MNSFSLMSSIPRRWTRLAGALLALASTATGRAETLIDDQFADGERSTQSLPASARWNLEASSGAYTSSVSAGSWSIMPPSAPSGIAAVACFAPLSPASLKAGESLVLSLRVQPTNPAGTLRFGIFNTKGERLRNDAAGFTSTFANAEGYAAVVRLDGGSVQIARRAKSAKGLWTESAFNVLSSKRSPITPSASYPVKLTVARTAAGKLTVSTNIAGTSVFADDTQGLAAFDTVAVFLDGSMSVTGLENVSLTRLAESSSETATRARTAEQGPAAMAALTGGSTWYLQFGNTSGQHWNVTTAWYSAPSGGGTNPSAMSSADSFNLNGFKANTTPISSGTVAFGGGELIFTPSSTLVVRGLNNTTTVIPNVTATGGGIANGGGTPQYINVPTLTHPSGDFTISTGASTRTVILNTGTLTGAGPLVFTGSGVFQLQLDHAYHFTGPLRVASGTMTFLNDLVTSGPLVISQPSKINLTKHVSCSSLTVTGASVTAAAGDKPGSFTYSPGTYPASTLAAAHPSLFVDGGGSITVRGGTTYYLKANQNPGASWRDAYASHFNTSPAGTGTNAAAVTGLDDFSTNGKFLRTPTSTDTFGGRTLLLQGGVLGLRHPISVICTVPTLVATSGTIVQYLGEPGVSTLRVNYFTQNPGTTSLSATAGQGVRLGIDYLSGSGQIRFATAGESVFDVIDASQFTGTYVQSSGTLRLDPITSGPVFGIGAPLAMKGRLVVGASAKVILNRDLYVGGLTVSGSVKPNGSYPASTLGFTGAAKVVVYTPDLVGPPQLFGVNFASGTFADDGSQFPTTAPSWEYYKQKKLTLIRVPFHWQQVQPEPGGDLKASIMQKLSDILRLANERGMKVIFDMHNYGHFEYDTQVIGASAVTYAHYQNVWHRLSAYFLTDPNRAALFGFDIMNEPKHLGNNWQVALKYAIDGIRGNDMSTYIIVEGNGSAGAQKWLDYSPDLGAIDPACRVIYSAHSYWGSTHDDNYGTYAAENGYPNMGRDQLRPYVSWLQKRKFKGFVGEYGVPTNVASPDSRWHDVLAIALQYMRDNGLSGTYWSAGRGWPNSYPLRSDINSPPQDAPVMSTLDDFYNP